MNYSAISTWEEQQCLQGMLVQSVTGSLQQQALLKWYVIWIERKLHFKTKIAAYDSKTQLGK